MSTLLMPVELRDAIVAYLSTKPYSEVANGIAMLQGLQAAPPPQPSPPPDAHQPAQPPKD